MDAAEGRRYRREEFRPGRHACLAVFALPALALAGRGTAAATVRGQTDVRCDRRKGGRHLFAVLAEVDDLR